MTADKCGSNYDPTPDKTKANEIAQDRAHTVICLDIDDTLLFSLRLVAGKKIGICQVSGIRDPGTFRF
jgi:hypothetical protein